jgi:prolyl-tRNA editing enzyme YbaK/EbsC (Cys-tRNA(Pro) deacylase)
VHHAVQRVVDAAARKGVSIEVTVFDDSTHTAEQAAGAVGAQLGQIVKSLVFVAPAGDTLRPVLCLVSGTNRVDVRRLAAVTGEPDIRRATAREANDLTGYVIGGIPPIGHARPPRVVMDPDLGRFQLVWAAAGTPTAVFPVPPGTLRMLANAQVAPIAEDRRWADGPAAAGAAAIAGPAAVAGPVTAEGPPSGDGDAPGPGDVADAVPNAATGRVEPADGAGESQPLGPAVRPAGC